MSDRMAQLEATSAILGEYMLRGYTLTDLSCDMCEVTPLMRESAASASNAGRAPIQFCALCDGRPDNVQPAAAVTTLRPEPSTTTTASASMASTSESASPPISRPPGLSAADLAEIYPPSSSSAQREQRAQPSQADNAASSISTLLLQGYSLLGANCPNPTCRGIPLVGYPKKKDGSKDGRKMCVSCHAAWIDEGDLGSMKVVEKRSQREDTIEDEEEVGGESPRSRKRRELYATGQEIVDSRLKQEEKVKAKGKEVAAQEEEDDMDLDLPPSPPSKSKLEMTEEAKTSPSVDALSRTSAALASTLDRLSASLERHSPNDTSDQARYFVDIKLHTEAMKDVLSVLEVVKKLQA